MSAPSRAFVDEVSWSSSPSTSSRHEGEVIAQSLEVARGNNTSSPSKGNHQHPDTLRRQSLNIDLPAFVEYQARDSDIANATGHHPPQMRTTRASRNQIAITAATEPNDETLTSSHSHLGTFAATTPDSSTSSARTSITPNYSAEMHQVVLQGVTNLRNEVSAANAASNDTSIVLRRAQRNLQHIHNEVQRALQPDKPETSLDARPASSLLLVEQDLVHELHQKIKAEEAEIQHAREKQQEYGNFYAGFTGSKARNLPRLSESQRNIDELETNLRHLKSLAQRLDETSAEVERLVLGFDVRRDRLEKTQRLWTELDMAVNDDRSAAAESM